MLLWQPAIKGQHAESLVPRGQLRRQVLFAKVCQWLATAGRVAPTSASITAEGPPSQSSARTAVLLAGVFAITWFISTAMAAHLPRLLQVQGVLLFSGLGLVALMLLCGLSATHSAH